MDITTNRHNAQTLNVPYCAADTGRGMVAAMLEMAEFCESYLSCTQPFVGLLSDIHALAEDIQNGTTDINKLEAWSETQEEIAEEIGYRLNQLNPTLDIVAYWDGERGGFFVEVESECDIYDQVATSQPAPH